MLFGWPNHTGYAYILEPPSLSWNYQNYYIQTPIISFLNNYTVACDDKDNDGFYYWGIGPKPISCPNCPSQPDCDDSNPFLGPSDNNYNCTINCNYFTYSSSPLEIDENQT